MTQKYNGKDFISDLKLYSDYLKYQDDKERYETWEEACDSVLNTHFLKYGKKVNKLLEYVKPLYYEKAFLPSQRNLQFREELILKNNTKIYNCCTTYAYSPDVFHKSFYVLLSGTGLGVSLRKKYISQLPKLNKRLEGTKTFIIPDSIEGWADGLKVLISSYCEHPSLFKEYFGYEIKFDYSEIRPKGSFISGGFKAPGHEGLQQSLERIESLLNSELIGKESSSFRSLVIYDIIMHAADAVLSGGVRRSACNILIDEDDYELLNAKIGNWRETNPQRGRSNNSVGLFRGKFSKERLKELVDLNSGTSDLGFVFVSHEDEIFNPCFEIGFCFYDEIPNKDESAFQFCNLCEINASACVDTKGRFSEDKFYQLCEATSIIGTLQAGYSSFPYLGKQTEDIVKGEALLGVSITGWMARPELFDERILQRGADIVKHTNKSVANTIGINQSARTTTVKPSGNSSVILKTPSGIHPEHSQRYFRIMQLNKESETAKFLEQNYPERLEESRWSASNTDYVVYNPLEAVKGTLFKSDTVGIEHLKLIKLVKENWVDYGKNEELCYYKHCSHNVSNTVIIDDTEAMVEYIFENQECFTAVSFLTNSGDKDYVQAPFTSVLNADELLEKYGKAVVFASGLIVDGLHYFNDNLWEATDIILHNKELEGTREKTLLRKDWIRRVKKFAKNYFRGDIKETIYCLKDVYLYHKWEVIMRNFKKVDFNEFLTKPEYTDINTLAAISCAGGACDIAW